MRASFPEAAHQGCPAGRLTPPFAALALLLSIACDDPGPVPAPLPYPECEGQGAVAPNLLASGELRSGPWMREKAVRERFRIEDRGCVIAVRSRQEWPLQVADLEALYDSNWRPLRVWQRLSLPDGQGREYRLYELRSDPPTRSFRNARGELERRRLKGARPEALIGPGRGLLGAWIRAANLPVGGKDRRPALDFRAFPRVREVTLKREADRWEASMKRRVRVYTVFGREAVFTDDDNVVIGDLAGLRPEASLPETKPPTRPMLPEGDPRHFPE